MARCEDGLPGVVQLAVLIQGESHHVRAVGPAALTEELPLVPTGGQAFGDLADVPVHLDERGCLESAPATQNPLPSSVLADIVRRSGGDDNSEWRGQVAALPRESSLASNARR